MTTDSSPDDSKANLNEKQSSVRGAKKPPSGDRWWDLSRWWTWKLQSPTPTDPEKGSRKKRRLILLGPFYAGCGAAMATCAYTSYVFLHLYMTGRECRFRGCWYRNPFRRVRARSRSEKICSGGHSTCNILRLDRKKFKFPGIPSINDSLNLVLLSATRRQHLINVLMSAAHQFLCSCSVRSLGPVAQYHENSMYYSAIKPEPNPEIDNNLPHITIQLPVYKESLDHTMYVRRRSCLSQSHMLL